MPTSPAGRHSYLTRHPILISGAIEIEGVAASRPVTGTLELFPNAGDVAMRYRLRTSEDDG
jgi:hypothetical protein